MIEFKCPKCGKLWRVNDDRAGRRAHCSCDNYCTVPTPEEGELLLATPADVTLPLAPPEAQPGRRRWRVVYLLVGLLVGLFALGMLIDWCESAPTGSPQPADPVPSAAVSKITAGLSKFTVDRANAQFVFTLEVSNQESREKTVHVVVYGKNDMFSPPRRSAWPFAGLLFRQAGTRRGALSSSDISRNWGSRPSNTRGAKMVLGPNASESLEGALPINDTCQQDAWRGKRLDPRSMYNEVFLWVFSHNGQLIFEREYDVK
ncbi:hypothetical protein LCGC14_2098880 [marine sediment metagenome]|uniref:Uncharacterized protein n=1 Tax=marine sediment metagenome TaxID=412755 RepID=A0A0F9H6Y9_9ZZZZ